MGFFAEFAFKSNSIIFILCMYYVSWLNQTMSGISLCLPVGVRSLSVWLSQDTELYFIPAPFTQLHCNSSGKSAACSLSQCCMLDRLLSPSLSRLAICTLYLGHDMIYMQLFYLLPCTYRHTHTATHTKQSWSRRFFYIFDAVRLGQSRQHFTYMESSHAITIFKICIKCTFKIYNLPLQSYFRLWCTSSCPISKRTFTILNCHRQTIPFRNVSRLMKHMKWRQITLTSTTTELLTGKLH